MSCYSQVEKLITEITADLYPEIDVLFRKIIALRKSEENTDALEKAFDIFDGLKEEFQSLKNYELKLVFPGVQRYYGDGSGVLPQNIRINELYELLHKKEDSIKNRVLDLEVETDDTGEVNAFNDLVVLFKDNYFCVKDAFYRCIAKLQKERTALNDKNVFVEDTRAV